MSAPKDEGRTPDLAHYLLLAVVGFALVVSWLAGSVASVIKAVPVLQAAARFTPDQETDRT